MQATSASGAMRPSLLCFRVTLALWMVEVQAAHAHARLCLPGCCRQHPLCWLEDVCQAGLLLSAAPSAQKAPPSPALVALRHQKQVHA